MQRIHGIAIGLSITTLLGLAAWLRVTSLGSLPEIDGDETWHAIQIVHMLRGEPFSIRTEHGLPLSPFHVALELPLLLAFRPSFALVRVPTVFTGLLAVYLTFTLGSRIFDRLSATIAAVLLAVLPVAVIFSRTGYESSHAPLYGVLLVYLAYRRRVVALCLLLSCCYFVHPTNIFLLPVLLVAMAFETLRGEHPPTRREHRTLFVQMAWPTLVVVIFGVFTIVRPVTDKLSSVYHLGIHGPHAWLEFWRDFGRLFLATGRTQRPWADRAFWVVVAILLIPGLVVLVRRRRLDLIAMIVAVFVSAFGVFLVGGSGFIQPGITRYGLFLVWPAVMAFSCAIRVLLIEPSNGWSEAARRSQEIALVVVAAILALSCDLRRVRMQVLDGPRRPDQSIWTLRDDREDSRSKALRHVASRVGEQPAVLIAPDFMTRRSLQYLALPRTGLKVVEFSALGTGDMLREVADRQLRGGAFVILPPGHPLEPTIRWLLSPYDHNVVSIRSGSSAPYTIYRVKKPIDVEQISKRSDSSGWRK